VPVHEEGRILYVVFNGGQPKYTSILGQVAMSGYEGIMFDESASPDSVGTRQSTGAHAA
jgi:hypothetical protein